MRIGGKSLLDVWIKIVVFVCFVSRKLLFFLQKHLCLFPLPFPTLFCLLLLTTFLLFLLLFHLPLVLADVRVNVVGAALLLLGLLAAILLACQQSNQQRAAERESADELREGGQGNA